MRSFANLKYQRHCIYTYPIFIKSFKRYESDKNSKDEEEASKEILSRMNANIKLQQFKKILNDPIEEDNDSLSKDPNREEYSKLLNELSTKVKITSSENNSIVKEQHVREKSDFNKNQNIMKKDSDDRKPTERNSKYNSYVDNFELIFGKESKFDNYPKKKLPIGNFSEANRIGVKVDEDHKQEGKKHTDIGFEQKQHVTSHADELENSNAVGVPYNETPDLRDNEKNSSLYKSTEPSFDKVKLNDQSFNFGSNSLVNEEEISDKLDNTERMFQAFMKKNKFLSTFDPNTKQKLFESIEILLCGHDIEVIKSYLQFIKMTAINLEILTSPITVLPYHRYMRTLLKSPHIFKRARVQYEWRTHKRYITLYRLTENNANVVLSYLQYHLPEGVAMEMEYKSIQPYTETL